MNTEFILNSAKATVKIDGEIRSFLASTSEEKVSSLLFSMKTACYQNAVDYKLDISNTGSALSPLITELYGLDIELSCDNTDKFLFNGLKGDCCSAESYSPLTREIVSGENFVYAPIGGRSSNMSAFPFFDFELNGVCFAIAVGWSGQWICRVVREDGYIRITIGQEYCRFRLKPCETARSVRILLYSCSGNSDDVRYGIRETIRKHCSPYTVLGEKLDCPVASQTFDRYYWNNTENYQNESTQIRLADIAGKVGQYNTYWVDAMWFKNAFPSGVGNYRFADGFPNGLSPLAEVVHKNNMRFMVWFEPERIDIGSDTYAAHGDEDGWLLNCEKSGRNRLLNLGNPDTLCWITKTVTDFIKSNKIDIYREDFNIDPLAFWLANDTEDRIGLTEMHFVEGLYKFWDALHEAFPDMLIDNCSSGGRRIDLETTSRAIPCWYSDLPCHDNSEEHQLSNWEQSQFTMLARYLPYYQSSSWDSSAYDMRSGMNEGMALAFPLMDADFDTESAAQAIAEIYRFRKYRKGRNRILTDFSVENDVWFAYQLDCGEEGCVFVFRRDKAVKNDFLLKIENIPSGKKVRMNIIDEDRNENEYVSDDGTVLLHSDRPRYSFAVEYRIE